MKKIAILIALMMCLSTAFAAEWADGRSPSKPYAGSPEVDLQKELGLAIGHPNAKMPADSCCEVLRVYLPREDVQAGTGRLFLCSETAGEVLRVEFNDETYVLQRAIEEEELVGLMWGSGTCFEITLPFSLALDEGYFVNMEANCIVTTDGKLGNKTVGGTDQWAFRTDREYGVGNKEYFHPVEGGEPEGRVVDPKAGDTVSFDVKLGGEAKMAVLYHKGDSMEFENATILESATVTGTALTDDVSWGVVFLNEANEILEVVDFTED